MIKANELRIGNWVNIGDLSTTINHIMGDDDYFDPIPLTPEILEKCGFREYGPFSPWLTLGSFSWSDPAGISYEIDEESAMLDHIKYLHQLQNLYYAVTGEELTITL
jgi:hypothetical protein